MHAPPPGCPAQLEFHLETVQEITPVPNRPGDYYLKIRTVPKAGRERGLYLTAVAEELGLSLRRVQELCQENKLRSYTPGEKHRRVKREWLDEYKRAKGIP